MSRDPSPSSKVSTYSRLSAARSREPSPASRSYTSVSQASEPLGSKDKSYASGSYLNNLSNSLEKTYISSLSNSRDPSPARRPSSIVSSFPRSRDPSPVERYRPKSAYQVTSERGSSRDPSPSITLNKSKIRESSPLSYASKYGSSSTSNTYSNGITRAVSSSTKAPDISISYMTANDTKARSSRASFINRHSPQKDKLDLPSMIPLRTESPKIKPDEPTKKQPESDSDSDESSSSSEETDSSEENVRVPETKIMIQVTTITRGTSPNPCSVAQSRTRRVEVAKTIEKVRQRPLQGPPMFDKSTQSDRMDDSTRNIRYAGTSRSTYSPYSRSPTNYTSRALSTLSTSHCSREPSENASVAESEKSETSDKTTQRSDKFNFPLPKSEEESSVKSESRKSAQASSSSTSKSSLDNQKLRLSISKSKTPDSQKLPPHSSPKSDSPKSASSKLSNKDFRKSALNMGPTDRVRRSKSSSSEVSSPTVEKTRLQFQQMLNGDSKIPISIERSSSVESESSTESDNENSQIKCEIKNPTKEQIICYKIEEAKSFLLKTLGNPTALSSLKSPSPSPSPMRELNGDCENMGKSCSTNYPTQTLSSNLDFSNLQKTESGEKAWWMNEGNETREKTSSEKVNQDETSQVTNGSDMASKTSNGPDDAQRGKWPWLENNRLSLNEKLQQIQRVQSGEKAWWCTSPENKTTSDNDTLTQHLDNTRSLWEQETQADVSELQRDEEFRGSEINHHLADLNQLYNNFGVSQLGDRASPEGLESIAIRLPLAKSPLGGNFPNEASHDFNARPRLFISRHTNIDDLLGKCL